MMNIKVNASLGKKSKNMAVLELDDGTRQRITYQSLREYWCYADPYQIEVIDYSQIDEYLIFWLTVAMGQGGIIAVWDATKEDWCHIQDGAYTICALLLKQFHALVALHYVSHYGISAFHMITATRFGVMNVNSSLETIQLPVQWEDLKFRLNDYEVDQMAVARDADEKIVQECGLLGIFYSKKSNLIYVHDACNFTQVSIDFIIDNLNKIS